MDTTARIAGADDLPVLAGLRRAWNEETAGGPVDDPGFDARLRAWIEAEGLGAVLMDAIVEWASQHGLVHLRLAPSPMSQSFYERLGFVPGAVVELDPPRP